jgi:predicted transcriptional regulator
MNSRIIGNNIREIWHESKLKLSQRGFELNMKMFSEKTGIPERTLYAYMKGDAEPTFCNGIKIADFLGVNPKQLLKK